MQIKGTCPHNCPDTCGWVITLDEAGTPVKIAGDAQHPYTRGWLCAKVSRYLEFTQHPERLTTPLRRIGARGEGRFVPISWDEALDEITERWQALIASEGPESILPYSYSGTLGMVQSAVCNARLWTRMGASGLDRTICSVAGTEAVRATIGGAYGADPETIPDSRLLLLWGTNPASTHPHMIPWIDQARKNGAKVYLIDPHRSLTVSRADVHLQPRPGSDAALALAVMHELFTHGWVDQVWAEAHTIGLAELRGRVCTWTPERAADVTGLPASAIRELAADWASRRPAMIRTSMGLQRRSNGGGAIRALACIPALTGDYGRPGGGLLYSTGGYWSFPTDVVCPRELSVGSPNPRPRVINMNRLGAALTESDPPIRALYVFNSNPAAVAPNSRRVREGLARPDLFTVVHELFMTDTARWADIVLPATSQFEHWDLHKAYGHLYLGLNQPATLPPGEARSNWEVMQLLAARLGYSEPSWSQTAEQIIQAALVAGGPAVTGITWEGLLENGHARLNYPRPHVPFGDGLFPTPSGKLELYSQQLEAQGLDPLPGYVPERESAEGNPERHSRFSLQLVSAASHYFLNSSFANLPTHRRLAGPAEVEIHPTDAEARGICEGEMVEVGNDRGAYRARARISDGVAPGSVFTPTLWWPQHAADGHGANDTTSDELADYAGGAVFHGNLVEIRPLGN